MYQKIKAEVQIFSVLLLAIIILILLSMTIGTHGQPPTVAAQRPKGNTPDPIPISEKTLAAFGLSQDAIQASGETFDLAVDISPSSISTASGSTIQFTASITNLGPDQASYIFFSNDFPAEMSNVNYQFSVTEVISDGQAKPTWLLPGPIDIGSANRVVVTMTGRIDTSCDTTTSNPVQVSAFDATADPNSANNTANANVETTGQGACSGSIYLPVIHRNPTPTPIPIVFFDDFSDDDSGWPKVDDGDCDSAYRDNEYRLVVDRNEECFRFAPQGAEITFGQFEVAARRSSGDDEYAYGIYTNGQGGDNYYLFRVWPNDNCGWQLKRRKSGNSSIVREGGCDSAINRGGGTNILKITHLSNGLISVYINNKLLSTHTDSSELTGKGTGVYARADDNNNFTARFDNFTVSLP